MYKHVGGNDLCGYTKVNNLEKTNILCDYGEISICAIAKLESFGYGQHHPTTPVIRSEFNPIRQAYWRAYAESFK